MRLRRFRKLSWLTCRGGGQGTYEYYSASETSTTYISPSSQVQNSYCLELVRISQITFTSTLLPNGHNKKAAIVGDLRLATWRNKLMTKHSFEFVEFARFLHKKKCKKDPLRKAPAICAWPSSCSPSESDVLQAGSSNPPPNSLPHEYRSQYLSSQRVDIWYHSDPHDQWKRVTWPFFCLPASGYL